MMSGRQTDVAGSFPAELKYPMNATLSRLGWLALTTILSSCSDTDSGSGDTTVRAGANNAGGATELIGQTGGTGSGGLAGVGGVVSGLGGAGGALGAGGMAAGGAPGVGGMGVGGMGFGGASGRGGAPGFGGALGLGGVPGLGGATTAGGSGTGTTGGAASDGGTPSLGGSSADIGGASSQSGGALSGGMPGQGGMPTSGGTDSNSGGQVAEGGAAGGGEGGVVGEGGESASLGGETGEGGAGGAAGFEPCPSNGEPCIVLPLGDSITYGMGSSDTGGYRSRLFALAVGAGKTLTFTGSQSNGPSEVAGVTFPRNHEGHSGWTIDPGYSSYGSGGISDLVPSPAFNTIPHIVLLMIGTNDVYAPSGHDTMIDRLEALLDEIVLVAPEALLVLATLTPLGWSTAVLTDYNAAIPGVVAARAELGQHMVAVDMATMPMSGLDDDNVHPNDQGYEFMAETWYAAIAAYLPE